MALYGVWKWDLFKFDDSKCLTEFKPGRHEVISNRLARLFACVQLPGNIDSI